MGDSSGGTPGPSGLNDLRDLLQRTKDRYEMIHSNKKLWPCPFCLHKAKSLFQCQMHVRSDHQNLARDTQNFVSQSDETCDSLSSENRDRDDVTPIDLTEFLQLINDATCDDSAKDKKDNSNVSQAEGSTNFFNFNEEDYEEETFLCPYDCNNKKPFNSLRGLNIHIGRMHKGKKKIKRNEIQYEYVCNINDDFSDFGQKLSFYRSTTATLRRCPKGARQDLAVALTNVIRQVVNENDEASWNNLLIFPYATLRIPSKDENVTNLTSFVRQNIRSWNVNDVNILENIAPNMSDNKRGNKIYGKVEAKLSDGDVSGALRLLSSDDCIAPKDEKTLKSLKEKHPAHPEPTFFPDSPIETEQIIPTEEEVQRSIMSFRNGTAGGLDSLRPQILKDLLNVQNGEVRNRLSTALTSLITIILSGTVPASVCRYLYGATLTALQKMCGGIRPIAVGNTWRRIAAKLACRRVLSTLLDILKPNQIGVGIKNGVEAGAHAARIYFNSKHASTRLFLKIDIRNAFNEVRRDVLLSEVKNNVPEIFKFVEQCYRHPTDVYYGESKIQSQRGVQQGDPLGPALFCLAIQRIISSLQMLNLDMNLWYLDDGTVAGEPEVVLKALNMIIDRADEIGLQLNYQKCEVSVLCTYSNEMKAGIIQNFRESFPDVKLMENDNAFLLGSPLTDHSATICLDRKIADLRRLTEKLKNMNAHSAFYLLKVSISTPRLIFFLRGNPMWKNNSGLERYDAVLQNSLESILNVQLSTRAWSESSLPIKYGGIGIRHATEIALPCFLSSMYEVSDLVDKLLSEPYQQLDPALLEAENIWCQKFGELPEEGFRNIQHAWESSEIEQKINVLSGSLEKQSEKARFKANSAPESGAWLHALPSPQLGTFLTNDEFRVALSLRLGSPIVQPHICVCGDRVNRYAHHGLSCAKASGTNPRHAAVNKIIQRALKSAGIPAILEPPGCSRPDGKQPDGMSLIPWARGRSLLWDYTCRDTFAPSYLNSSSRHVGHVAKEAERKKIDHYSELAHHFIFIPVATETSGVIGKLGMDLIRNIGSKITDATKEKRATSYFIQRISIAIQKGNVASILGTIPHTKDLAEIFYL